MKIFDIKTLEQLKSVPETMPNFDMFQKNTPPEILSAKFVLDMYMTNDYNYFVGTIMKIEMYQPFYGIDKQIAYLELLFEQLNITDLFSYRYSSNESRKQNQYGFIFLPKSESLFNDTFGDVQKEKTKYYTIYHDNMKLSGWYSNLEFAKAAGRI